MENYTSDWVILWHNVVETYGLVHFTDDLDVGRDSRIIFKDFLKISPP